MSLLNILRYPDARLHKVALPVTVFDESLKKLVRDLERTSSRLSHLTGAPGHRMIHN